MLSKMNSDPFILAQEAYRTGDRSLAEQRLRNVVKDNPQNDAAWLLLSKCTENWEEKIEYVKKCILSNRNNCEGLKTWRDYCGEIPSFYHCRPVTLYEVPVPENWVARLPSRYGAEQGFEDGNWFAELMVSIWSRAGKQGFEVQGNLFNTAYDRIIKLTYSHYLCVKNDECTLFRDHQMFLLLPVATLRVQGEITPDTFSTALATQHPQIYSHLSKLLYKEPLKRGYISHYRYYAWGFDDFKNCLAVRRVWLGDDFSVIPLDLVMD